MCNNHVCGHGRTPVQKEVRGGSRVTPSHNEPGLTLVSLFWPNRLASKSLIFKSKFWSLCSSSHLYLLRIQADMACFSMGVMGIKHLSSHCTLNCLTHWNISPVSHEHSLNNCADEFHLTRVDRYLGKDKSGYNWQILFSSKSFLPSSLPSLPSFQTDFEFMVFLPQSPNVLRLQVWQPHPT